MIDDYLKAILAAEDQAKKIENDARAEAERIVSAAGEQRDKLLAEAEARARTRLAQLRAQAEAEGKAQAAKLEAEHEKLISALRARYQERHADVVNKANLNLSALLSLAKE